MSLEQLQNYVRPGGPAERPCEPCGGTGVHHAKDFEGDSLQSLGTNSVCPECSGAGVIAISLPSKIQ